MIATAFDEENMVFDPPHGVTLDECSVLSCFKGMNADGKEVIISCWKPTPEEWDEMKRTGRVWVVIWGNQLPPLAPCGISPFRDTPYPDN